MTSGDNKGMDSTAQRRARLARAAMLGLPAVAELAARIRILAGLGLRDHTQAVLAAYESGLVIPGRERG